MNRRQFLQSTVAALVILALPKPAKAALTGHVVVASASGAGDGICLPVCLPMGSAPPAPQNHTTYIPIYTNTDGN